MTECKDYLTVDESLAILSLAALVQTRPPVGEILCWATVCQRGQSRWLATDRQGCRTQAPLGSLTGTRGKELMEFKVN